eukprot:317914-Rhodomonas_salina.1
MAFSKHKYSGVRVGKWKRYKQTITGKSRVRTRMSGAAKETLAHSLTYKIRKTVNAMAETKEVMLNLLTNGQLTHNTIHNIYNNAFYTKLGVAGEQLTSSAAGSRVGKKAYIKGISVSLHIENQQYHPDCKFCLMLIRNKVSKDTPITTPAQIFEGLSSTLFLDWVDTGKVNILFRKYICVKAPNVGTTLTAGAAGVFDHGEVEGVLPDLYEGINMVSTNPRYLSKFYVPINKDVMYNDYDGTVGTVETIPASYLYQWVIYGYDNSTTPSGSTTWPLAHMTMTTKLKFKDI